MRDLPEGVTELTKDDITMCALCGGPLVGEGNIQFYRVRIATALPDFNALQERAGLAALWHNAPGSAELADVFAPSRAVAHEMPAGTANVCAKCAFEPRAIAAVQEAIGEKGG